MVLAEKETQEAFHLLKVMTAETAAEIILAAEAAELAL
jgi:hypothetical protein